MTETHARPRGGKTSRQHSHFKLQVWDDVFFCKERYCPIKRRFSSCGDELKRRDLKSVLRVLSMRREKAYVKPRVGPDYQCVVPKFGRESSPCRERGDKLVFAPEHAFAGLTGHARGAEVEALLNRFRINESSSAGVSEELALISLFQSGGDVQRAERHLNKVKLQHQAGGGQDAAAAALRRQAQAMLRERKEHEREISQQRSKAFRPLDLGAEDHDCAVGGRARAMSSQTADLHSAAVTGVEGGYKAVVELDCHKAAPDGECSNRGVFFDVVNTSKMPVLVTAFSAGTFDDDAQVCVWACKEGKSAGCEQRSRAWHQICRSTVHAKTKTPLPLKIPLLLASGQEQGILMHCSNNRVCYSPKLQASQDAVLLLRPWYATGSEEPFGAHQHGDFKYTHAGSVSYCLAEPQQAVEPKAGDVRKEGGPPIKRSRAEVERDTSEDQCDLTRTADNETRMATMSTGCLGPHDAATASPGSKAARDVLTAANTAVPTRAGQSRTLGSCVAKPRLQRTSILPQGAGLGGGRGAGGQGRVLWQSRAARSLVGGVAGETRTEGGDGEGGYAGRASDGVCQTHVEHPDFRLAITASGYCVFLCLTHICAGTCVCCVVCLCHVWQKVVLRAQRQNIVTRELVREKACLASHIRLL